MMDRRKLSRVAIVLWLALSVTVGWTSVAHGQAATPATSPMASPMAASGVRIVGEVKSPLALTVGDLQALAPQQVNVTFQAGKGEQKHSYTGALLSDVIAKAGLKLNPARKNDALSKYLLVTANDGYQVVISWGEIDPKFGNHPYLLAWEQDGQPLTGADGPIHLITPGDVHGGRYVSGVVSIEVRGTDSAPAAS